MHLSLRRVMILSIILTVTEAGCRNRALEISELASRRQADQNKVFAALQSDVAKGAHELISAERTATEDRREQASALAFERRLLATGWNDIEKSRLRATAFRVGSEFLVGLLTLTFAWLALFGIRREALSEAALELYLPMLGSALENLAQPPITSAPLQRVEAKTGEPARALHSADPANRAPRLS